MLKDKKVAEEYRKLAPRYALISQLIEARAKRGITQEELAKRSGTKQSAIARLESGNINPTIAFLEKIVNSLGAKLTLRVE